MTDLVGSPGRPASDAKRLTLRDTHLLRIAGLALAFRLLTSLLAFLINTVFPMYQREQFTVLGYTHLFWDPFARYDSGWYNGIARGGYAFVEGGRSNLAFFPVYPLLMRYVGRLFGGRYEDFYFAGILISWIAFSFAMVMLFLVARLDLTRRLADRAVLYAAIFPFAFFYGVVYSESLFLLLTLACVYAIRTRNWWVAGFSGALATATRVNGVMALPALACLAWQNADARERWKAAVALGLTAAGAGTYYLYVYSLSGSFVEWMNSIQRWGYTPGRMPWTPFAALLRSLVTQPYLYLTTERLAPYDLLNGGAALVFAVTIPFVWSRLGAGYGLFMLVNLWLPLSSGSFEGLGRYCSVLFPVFIWLASLRSGTVHTSVVVVSSLLYTLCLALFTKIHPIF